MTMTGVKAFLEEVVAVCRKHGYSLSHEESYGVLEIVPFNEYYVGWLMQADAEDEQDGAVCC